MQKTQETYIEKDAIHKLIDRICGDKFYGTLTVKFEAGKPKLAFEERVWNAQSLDDVINSPSSGEISGLPKSMKPIKKRLLVKAKYVPEGN